MEGPKPHKNWSNEMIKVLLDTCIEEMKTTGRNGVSLYRLSWVRLGRVLKDKFGMEFTQKEMKNGFDILKEKYVGWLYLKNKTGNIYNSQTKMFNLTPKQWEDFKKANSERSGASRSATLASGASGMWEPVGAININDDPLVDVDIDDEDDGNSRTQRIHDEVRPKKKAKTSHVTLDDMTVDMQCALRHMVKTKDGPTSSECAEQLKLVDLPRSDPLFLAAFNIFCQSRDMRDAWMALPSDPYILKGWIEITSKTFGIFK
ncbi:myb/SANT-like domain, Harbinger transposase-derived nuclease domain protein [Artemisia annua]|uniref:Myb/SANT-like domain, Harbinger transposase-derived nuclease domain protein n=1 Tax=Artemisia annua TaxID=35608 RepID=A0A2U1MS40_ARTAN|nr:myb/SANT-like domain, Harbinger transposase-derived nuclease domain protein [Artemisia annua]